MKALLLHHPCTRPRFERDFLGRLVTSGRAVRNLLEDDGVEADWVAKAFEPHRFADLEGERAGIVTCDSEYRCRVVAERAIVEAGLPLPRSSPAARYCWPAARPRRA